jgi:hypothetical protein
LGEYITANPGVEIDEIDSEGRQIASSTAEPGVAVTEVDVMPAVQSASAMHAEPVAVSSQNPDWME